MADFDTYKDKIIVFEAVKASDTSRLVTRQPLRPTNNQLPSSPRASSHKSVDIKPSTDGASDENHNPPLATPYDSLLSSRAMYGQALSAVTQPNGHSLPYSPGRNSHNSASTPPPSAARPPSTKSHLTPYSSATNPLSTSNSPSRSVDMAGFDRYYANLHDKIQAKLPGFNDSAYILT